MTNIRNINHRFNLNKEKHRRAWKHLQRMDKQIFRFPRLCQVNSHAHKRAPR